MSFRSPRLSNVYEKLSLGRITFLIFSNTGLLFALGNWGPLPDDVSIVGAPAIIATISAESWLYRDLSISTGRPYTYTIVCTFMLVQSVIVAGAVRTALPILVVGSDRVL